MHVLRIVVSVVWLAACGAPKTTGPAWPAPSATAEDGGESIEPRTTSVAASVEKSADEPTKKDDKPAAEAIKPADATDAGDSKPATPGQPSTPVLDDVIMSDDMIIEIEDDE